MAYHNRKNMYTNGKKVERLINIIEYEVQKSNSLRRTRARIAKDFKESERLNQNLGNGEARG